MDPVYDGVFRSDGVCFCEAVVLGDQGKDGAADEKGLYRVM